MLEDLHWADPDTLAVVEYLADNLPRRAGAVPGHRPEPEPSAASGDGRRLRGRTRGTHLPLDRLMTRAGRGDGAGVPDPDAGRDQVARVQRAAEGVPFLVEEVLASPGVPASFADTVRERLGGLTTHERAVLDAAAVLGRAL